MEQGIPLAEAVLALGLSADAIRKRLARGTLRGYRDGRRWYVILDQDARPDSDQPRQDATGQLVVSLQAEVSWLREQMERQSQVIAQQTQVIGAMTQRLPELPATTTMASMPVDTSRPPAEQRAPWLQRIRQVLGL